MIIKQQSMNSYANNNTICTFWYKNEIKFTRAQHTEGFTNMDQSDFNQKKKAN